MQTSLYFMQFIWAIRLYCSKMAFVTCSAGRYCTTIDKESFRGASSGSIGLVAMVEMVPIERSDSNG